MPRFIPIQLKDHLRGPATSTAYLLRIDPVTPGYSSYGVTSLDKDITYDDGLSELTYRAAIGTQPTALQGSSNLSVDNAESSGLLPEFDVPVSEADIRAGVYDFADFRLYLVNYEDLTQGHVLLRAGTTGRITIDADGMSTVTELRGYSAELKQSVCAKDSLSCRAIFGSQPPGSSTPGPEVQRDWCGFDATTLLVASTVSSVGLENTLTFNIAAFTMAEDELNPGIVIFTSGLNAGKTYEIDSNTAGGLITLAYETAFPIAPGDGVQYRPDCNKIARDDEKGCQRWFGDDWVLHFRGEPDIPIGDAGALETPGASSRPGQGGYTNIPFSSEAEE